MIRSQDVKIIIPPIQLQQHSQSAVTERLHFRRSCEQTLKTQIIFVPNYSRELTQKKYVTATFYSGICQINRLHNKRTSVKLNCWFKSVRGIKFEYDEIVNYFHRDSTNICTIVEALIFALRGVYSKLCRRIHLFCKRLEIE